MLQSFVKTYADHSYRFPVLVRHAGLVVGFAMDERRAIHYTVLDLAHAPSPLDVSAWLANPRELTFASELAKVGFGAADQTQLPSVRLGTTTPSPTGTPIDTAEIDPFLSSTARLTAAAPFTVVSDGQFLCVFRQAIAEPSAAALVAAQHIADSRSSDPEARAAYELLTDHGNMVFVDDENGSPVPLVAGTVLVDRFLLVGTELQPKLEVRYQRSRSKTRPASRTDSLGARDLDQHPFIEPTQELGFVAGFDPGRFGVVEVPTTVADTYRWQLFTADSRRGLIWSYSIERSGDGLFDTLGSQVWTCTDHPDLFATMPGSCPRPNAEDASQVCGKPLVPRVDTSDAPGTALDLGGDGNRIELADTPALGPTFTLETWVAPAQGATGERRLFGGGTDDGQAGPSLWIVDGAQVKVGFGDGKTLRTTTSPGVLTPGAWQHLAVSFDGTSLTVVLNGRAVHATQELSGAVPAAGPITEIGAASTGFQGALDDIRFWSIARTVAEIRSTQHIRLSGLESELAAYWRLDEGTGNKTWDQAGAATGAITGATWVSSGAAIGETAGLTRRAIRLADRMPAGGVGAVLYYLQESASSGYDQTPKPQKSAARVMLAAVTAAGDSAGEVAVLDFAVAADGRLTDVPTELALPQLAAPGGNDSNANEILDRLAADESRVAALESDISATSQIVEELTAGIASAQLAMRGQPAVPTPAGAAADLAAPAQDYLKAFQFLTGLIDSGLPLNAPIITQAQIALQPLSVTLSDAINRHQGDLQQQQAALAASGQQLAAAQADLAGVRAEVAGDVSLPMPLLHLDAGGRSVAGALLGFAGVGADPRDPSGGTPLLFDSALGRLGLYFRGASGQLSVAYYDTATGRPAFTVPAGTNSTVAFVSRSAEPELDQLTVATGDGDDTTVTLTVSLTRDGAPVTENWPRLPRDPALLAQILNGTTPAPTPIATAAAASGKVESLHLTTPVRTAVPAGALLSADGAVLTVATAVKRGATAIPVMPASVTVPDQATVTRLLYDYDEASTTLSGASLRTGSRLVAVDARAADGPIALRTTATAVPSAPSARWYGAPPGTTLAFDGKGTFAGRLTATALTFDGAHDWVAIDAAPNMDIAGPITIEAWIRPTATDGLRDIVARGYVTDPAGEVVLRLNGNTYQTGSWNGADHIASAAMPPGDVGTWVHLAGVYDGAAWQLYRNGVLVATTVDSVGAVPVHAGWSIGAASSGTERLFAGDIDEVRIWNRARDAADIRDAMARRLTGTEAGLVGYWFAIGGTLTDRTNPPTSVTAHGAPKPAASPPELVSLDGLDVRSDLTLEAWVNPGLGDDFARLVQQRSAASSYLLGLRSVPSALTFDGTSSYVTIPASPSLNVTGPITIEAWVLPAAKDGLRYVVAHGLQRTNPPLEVALRLANGSYQVGTYDGADHYAVAPIPDADVGHWVHLAGVHTGTEWQLYRNGELLARQSDPHGAIAINADWAIGGSASNERFFAGRIGEVRLWAGARTPAQIADTARRWLIGDEDGLLACFRYDGTALADHGPRRYPVVPHGTLPGTNGPLPAVRAVAGVNGQYVATAEPFAGGSWSHLAAVYTQRFAVRIAGPDGYLDAGTKSTFNLSNDLTVEATVQLDDLVAEQGLITRGTLGAGGDQVPFAVTVRTDGRVVLSFQDTAGKIQHEQSNAGVITPGKVHRIGVTRKRTSTIDTTNGVVVNTSYQIAFAVDGAPAGGTTYTGKDPGSSNQALLLGRAHADDSTPLPLRGTLVEMRLWSVARDAANVGGPITGSETGLVAWWRFGEATGNTTTDAKAGHPATFHGAVAWVKTPDAGVSALTMLLNGAAVATTPVTDASTYDSVPEQFSLGANAATLSDRLQGALEEVRIWRVARTPEQIEDNLYRRLTGDWEQLLAYYTFDAEPGHRLPDMGLHGNDLYVAGGTYEPSTAPIGEDAPQVRNAVAGLVTDYTATLSGSPAVAEYADLQQAGDGTTTGVFKRCYGYIDPAGAWQLVTGFKIGDLAVEWVGQAQFDPQLIGYVEGAPPVPSENLTVSSDGYQGASSVVLSDATSTTYTYASSRSAGVDASLAASESFGDKSQSLVGAMEIEAPLGLGLGEIELTTVEETEVSGGLSLQVDTSTSWLSSAESGTGTTVTRASTVALTGHQESANAPAHKALGPRWVPDNVGIALVQSQTADVYALRIAHSGALVAYQMRPNPDIPKDWNLISFPLDPRYTKQGALDGKVGLDPDEDYPNALTYTGDASYFKPIEAYQLKQQVTRAEEELATLFAQFDAGPGGLSADTTGTVPKPTARNLVNTYVWTASGGQFAETEQTLDSVSETTGGSFSFSTMLGANIHADIAAITVDVSFDVSVAVGAHLELEVSKTMDSEHSFELDVSTSPEQDITRVDDSGKRSLVPGKVDAYRFMTFYLAPQSAFHDTFFNQVVDPLWLAQSSDPAAVALREARQPGTQPACWRILHRVTYVSRVLAPLDDHPPELDAALQSLDIQSNYQLIQTLDPYLQGKTASYTDFAPAVRSAIARRLPELTAHADDILAFLVLYYGVADAPQLSAQGV